MLKYLSGLLFILWPWTLSGQTLLSKPKTKLQCQVQWGEIKKSGSLCQFKVQSEKLTDGVFRVKNPMPRQKIKDSFLKLRLRGSHFIYLQGIELRLYDTHETVLGKVTLPFFSDPHQNLLQDKIDTFWSVPLSEIQTDNWNQLLNSPIETLEFYISHQKLANLTIEVVDVDWLPRSTHNGKITFTFDDGYTSHHRAASIMQKYKMKGTAYIIDYAIGQKKYMTRSQLQDLLRWGWDISSHDEAPVIEPQPPLLKRRLLTVRKKISQLSSENQSAHFAYPRGQYNTSSYGLIQQIYSTARLAGGGYETLPAGDFHRLRALNVTPDRTPQQIAEMARKAVANGDWIILMFHHFDDESKGELNYSFKNFEEILKLLQSEKNAVLPISEVFKKLKQ